MLFTLKVAWRYLFANIGQTLLLIAGVALGAVAFVYITTLINGLRDRQIKLTTSSIAHITLEAREKNPQTSLTLSDGAIGLVAVQPDTASRAQIREWSGFVRQLETFPDVTAVSPEISTSGFIVRAAMVKPVSITGLQPDKMNLIVNIKDNLTDGVAQLDGASAIIGFDLAKDLGIGVGQTIRIRSDRQVEQLLTVRGIIRTGSRGLDSRLLFVNFDRARALAALPYGITDINLRVKDQFKAPDIAALISDRTGLKAKDWISDNARLADALNAQRRSGNLIQGFSLLTVVIGVSSALLLMAYRRRAEIGIMRAMGISKGFVAMVFILQGGLIGLIGSCTGAFAGFQLTTFLLTVGVRSDGSPLLPLDPAQGQYPLLIVLVTLGAILSALIPARLAAKIDPVEAIGA